MPHVDFSLYLISDRQRVPAGRTLLSQIEAALAGGVKAVQLREKDLSAAQLYPLALELRALTRRYSAKLLINDRIDLALAVTADGVHLGGHSLPVSTVRALLGPQRLIGVSTHAVAEAEQAFADGADFVTFGPIYPTPSKLPLGDPVGIEPLAQLCQKKYGPVFALGGVTTERLDELIPCGVDGIALIAAMIACGDPKKAAHALLERLPPVDRPE